MTAMRSDLMSSTWESGSTTPLFLSLNGGFSKKKLSDVDMLDDVRNTKKSACVQPQGQQTPNLERNESEQFEQFLCAVGYDYKQIT